jgi:hypothetical protein
VKVSFSVFGVRVPDLVGVGIGVLFLAVIGCAKGWDDPLPTTPSKDYPCGVSYVACVNVDTGKLTGMCCDENTTCGGNAPGYFNTCPLGYCCYIGPPDTASRADGGSDGGILVEAGVVKVRSKQFKANGEGR